jgi:hypothetical protein
LDAVEKGSTFAPALSAKHTDNASQEAYFFAENLSSKGLWIGKLDVSL